MARQIVTDARDRLTEPVRDYLADRYGELLVSDTQRIELHSPVGDVQRIVVTLLVEAPDTLEG